MVQVKNIEISLFQKGRRRRLIMISMEDKQNYFRNKIVLLNVFATFMVVALHALPNERFGMNIDASCVVIYLLRAICQVGVPLFFFISAVLFYNTVNSYKDISKKNPSTFSDIACPLFIMECIFCGGLLCINQYSIH